MTIARVQLKKVPDAPLSKQMLAMALIVTAGLLIFLIIAVVAPKSSDLLEASRDFDTRIALPQNVAKVLPVGVSVNDLVEKEPVSKQQPVNLDLTRGFILSDQDHRLSTAFRVADAIKKETALWFDIYTKYPRTTWLIINESTSPSIVEEWPIEKITAQIGDGPSTSKVISFLRGRMALLAQVRSGTLRIQQGLSEDFKNQVTRMNRWMPAIEKIFKAQKLPVELTSLFIIPANMSLGETETPWKTMNSDFVPKYLLKTDSIDETHSPIKVARALATHLKDQRVNKFKWSKDFLGSSAREPNFEAALHAEAYLDELHMNLNEKANSRTFKAFKLARSTTVVELSKQLKTPIEKFLANNPDIISKDKLTQLPKSYVFFVLK